MKRTMFKSKIHRATVTHADLHYVGSVTIDTELLEAANIFPGELVAIVDVTNGARIETYVIAGEPGSGVIGINGAAAHLVHEGDKVIIITYTTMSDRKARSFKPSVVHVDASNCIVTAGTDPAAAVAGTSAPPLAVMSTDGTANAQGGTAKMTPSLDELAEIVGEMQDRDAIWQCLQRYARGVDRFDRELIRSAFHPDAMDDHGKFLGGPQDFIEWAMRQHTEAHLGHQHNLFNHTCELSGDVAHAETYFMFAGMNRKGTPVVLNGGRYLDRLEKRHGEWRIAYRTLVRDWGLMDDAPNPDEQSSYTSTRAYLSDQVRDFMNECPPGRRDATDPSYQRPLEVSPERVESWKRLNISINDAANHGATK